MSGEQRKEEQQLDFISDAKLCSDFLDEFPAHSEEKKYYKALQSIAAGESSVLAIDLDDVAEFERDQTTDRPTGSLVARIESNALRYVNVFYKLADKTIPGLELEHLKQDNSDDLIIQRRKRLLDLTVNGIIPPELTRRYELRFVPRKRMMSLHMRKVMGAQIGHYVKIKGVVLRSTPVHPLVRVAAYHCSACKEMVYQIIDARQYTPLSNCPTTQCITNKTSNTLTFQPQDSKFIKFQEMRLQELTSEVPVGHIPRTLTVYLQGEMTQTCLPGDVIALSGIFLPLPATAFAKLRMGLLVETYVQGHHIEKISRTGGAPSDELLTEEMAEKRRNEEIQILLNSMFARTGAADRVVELDDVEEAAASEGSSSSSSSSSSSAAASEPAMTPQQLLAQLKLMTPEERRIRVLDERVLQLRASLNQGLYSLLASSIAPQIYGLEDVKQALLLQMVSSPAVQTPDGMRIRGDIHICLMGDPGVAKSQLLKAVCDLAPRAVYTTGKGSTGVGLTAAVLKDTVTGQTILEGGSLVMADRGICCIDEFDKMEDADKTAIHEVMEQQTVSIAKGGINTTLNARTAILAAANPAFGRYNKRRTPWENINLPPALLSRFDLLFILIDTPDMERDRRLAEYVTTVHRTKRSPLATAVQQQKQQQKQQQRQKSRKRGRGGKRRAADEAAAAAADDAETGAMAMLNSEGLVPHELLTHYIRKAKELDPVIPEALNETITQLYTEMRRAELETDRPTTYTSARSLLAILRLSRALARLRLSSTVSAGDLEEAQRLVDASRAQVATEGAAERAHAAAQKSRQAQIYQALKDLAQQEAIQMKEKERKAKRQGKAAAKKERGGRRKVKAMAGLGVVDVDAEEAELEGAVVLDSESSESDVVEQTSQIVTLQREDVEEAMVRRGFSAAEFNQFLDDYSDLGFLEVDGNQITIASGV